MHLIVRAFAALSSTGPHCAASTNGCALCALLHLRPILE
jgi:hypothetical protein